MPADKLILICPRLKKGFEVLAVEKGRSWGGYAHVMDLRETDFRIPALLYHKGFRNGMNKIEFVKVARLGLTRTQQIAKQIFGDLQHVKISRIDWCVDVLGISAWDLALCCRISGVQNFAVYRSHDGDSIYPHRSKDRAVLIYDRLKRLRSMRDSLARVFRQGDQLTRIEVQLRGSGVAFRRFVDIHRYAEIDLLENLTSWKLLPIPERLKPMQRLAVERLHTIIHELGLQAASKRFSSGAWAYLSKKFLAPISEEIPNLNSSMRKSTRDWLEDRIRFPRARQSDEVFR